MNHVADYFEEVQEIAKRIDRDAIGKIAEGLSDLRTRGGRLFLLGVGGSAANCSHAVNDFRKLCGIEAYTPVDNVSELTARTNDEGWETVFAAWLKVSRANNNDAVLVFSVGGGDAEKNISVNLIRALDEAKRRGLKIYGVVGRQGGYTKLVGDAVVVEGHDSHCRPPRPRGASRGGRTGSGGETRTLNISVNSRTLCRLSYPGMAFDDSSARTSPMTRRCVAEHA